MKKTVLLLQVVFFILIGVTGTSAQSKPKKNTNKSAAVEKEKRS